MKISDKNFKFNDHYNCYQCAIEAAANIYEVDFQIIGLGTCNFMYLRDDDLIGKRLRPHFFRDTKVWKKYSKLVTSGLDYERLEKDWTIGLLEKYEIIMAFGDIFFCPWTKVYLQNHNFHAFLIVDYIEQTDMFQIVDTYMGNNVFECSFDDMQNLVSGLYYFSLRPEPVYADEEYIDEIKRDAEFYFEKACDKHFSDFTEDMLNEFNFEREINYAGSNAYTVPVVSNLDMLLRNRKGYEILLDYYNKRFKLSSGDVYVDMIKKCINSISKIKLEFLKSAMRKRYATASEMTVKNELLMWKDAELRLMDSLLEI